MKSVGAGAKVAFVFSILFCLISMIGASIIQTNMYEIKVKDIQIETSTGRKLSLLLFIPPNATKKMPAPAIVVSHGWYNNREMQDLNYVELSRRGFVVASIDMYGHGNSDPLPSNEIEVQGTGMYDAVEFLATLPYVNKKNIGVTGHSNGARAANFSVDIDNTKRVPLIRSVLLIGNDANYRNNNNNRFYNKYGSRDVGIIASQYDEFFFRTYNKNGTVTAPRDFINQPTAQSFLHFGKDAQARRLAKRQASTIYKERISGINAIRVIYTPNEIHPWNHFSQTTTASTIDFFQTSLPVPNPLPSDNQIWQVKVGFNALGLVGIMLFVLSFTRIMLHTSYFSSLLVNEGYEDEEVVEALESPGFLGYIWFLISIALSVGFSVVSYVYLFGIAQENTAKLIAEKSFFVNFIHQSSPLFIGLWSLVNAFFILLLILIGNNFSNSHATREERGLSIAFGKFIKTIFLAIIVSFCTYIPVFTADIFFTTDFRLWVLPLKAFTPDKLYYVALYLPFFLIFYTINSISINCYNYIRPLPNFINIFFLAIMNALPAGIILYFQYFTFFTTGRTYLEVMYNNVFYNIIGIWLFPVLIFLFIFAFFTRSLFKETRNPYLGAFIFSIIITIIACTNTLTEIPF